MSVGDRKLLSAALLAAMRPIASMLVRFGVGYREFADVCKWAFVTVATEEFGKGGRPANLSRVAALTGLSRKEVRRVRLLALDSALPPAQPFNAQAEVLQVWHSDPRFQGPDGAPAPLPLEGGARSFGALVRSCSADLPVDGIRAELRRGGALVERPDGLLELRRRHFVPETPDARLIEGITFGLRTIAATVAHNAGEKPGGTGRFQRLVHNRFIPRSRGPEVEEAMRQRLTEFSEELDDYFAEVGLPNPSPDTCVVGVGLYYYEDPAAHGSRPPTGSGSQP